MTPRAARDGGNASLPKVHRLGKDGENDKIRFHTGHAITVALSAFGLILALARIGSPMNDAGGRPKNAYNYPPDPEAPQPASWSKLRTFRRGVVCADGEPCAFIGKTMLDRNGSAVDAALAALICNGMINMQSMGLGGGFLMTIYERATERAVVLDARECAPGAVRPDMYSDEFEDASRVGALAIGVPGELAGYWEAHRRFGKLSWADIFRPSIELCEKGYSLSKAQYDGLVVNEANIYGDSTLREMFVNPETSKFFAPGSIVRPRMLCKTMRIIAAKNASELYNGTTGRVLVEDVRRRGGVLTTKDLNDYRIRWREPVTATMSNGVTLHSAGLPGSGNLLAFALNVLDEFHLTPESVSHPNLTIATYHRIIETFKYTFALRGGLGDRSGDDIADVTDLVEDLSSKDYAKSVRTRISDERTSSAPRHYGASYAGNEDHGTAHVSVLAANGDAVSVTSSVNLYFGSGVVSERTGILMNSGMDDFGVPSRRNYFDLPPSPRNSIEPGKRPLSSMVPSILVEDNGDVRMVIGAAGGTKITTAVAYVIARHLWLKETVKQAVDAARIHHQLFPMRVAYEFGVPKPIIDGLRQLGHEVARYKDRGSVVSALVRSNGTVYANVDYRKGGEISGID